MVKERDELTTPTAEELDTQVGEVTSDERWYHKWWSWALGGLALTGLAAGVISVREGAQNEDANSNAPDGAPPASAPPAESEAAPAVEPVFPTAADPQELVNQIYQNKNNAYKAPSLDGAGNLLNYMYLGDPSVGLEGKDTVIGQETIDHITTALNYRQTVEDMSYGFTFTGKVLQSDISDPSELTVLVKETQVESGEYVNAQTYTNYYVFTFGKKVFENGSEGSLISYGDHLDDAEVQLYLNDPSKLQNFEAPTA